MSGLVPTPITDRNGKQTTVYRRSEKKAGGTGLASLAAAKPTVATPEPPDSGPRMVKLPASKLSRNGFPRESSIINRSNMYHWLIEGLWNGNTGEFIWEPQDTEIPDEDLYGYLRLGLGVNEAAMLHSVGATPEMVGGDEHFANELPGDLAKYVERENLWPLRQQAAIDAMQAHGVPAEEAHALLVNGLQDGHLGKALGFEQLREVFGKFRYYGQAVDWAEQKTSKAINGLLSGLIPFELSRMCSAADLGRLAEQLEQLGPKDDYQQWMQRDPELTMRVVAHGMKGFARQDGYKDRALTKAFALYAERGEEMFAVNALDLLANSHHNWETGVHTPITVDEVLFAEEVAKGMRGKKDRFGKPKWRALWTGYKANDTTTKLSQWDIFELRDAGASVEQVRDLLIEKELSREHALAIIRDGAAPSLIEGLL